MTRYLDLLEKMDLAEAWTASRNVLFWVVLGQSGAESPMFCKSAVNGIDYEPNFRGSYDCKRPITVIL